MFTLSFILVVKLNTLLCSFLKITIIKIIIIISLNLDECDFQQENKNYELIAAKLTSGNN